MIKEKKLYSRALYIFGILAPMLIINVFSTTMYVWGILLLGCMALGEWIRQGRIKVLRNREKAFTAVVITWVISYVICALRMPAQWKNGIVTSFIQLCFFIIVYIFFDSKNRIGYLVYYIKGVYLSVVIQMIWGYAQFLFDMLGMDLNSLVFKDILHMMGEYTTQYQFGRLKVSGMCWNAGNLAPLVTFGYIYSNNMYLKGAFLILGFVSGSRTLMLGLMVCVILQFMLAKNRRRMRLTSKKLVFGLLGTGVLFVVIVKYGNAIVEKVIEISDLLNLKERVKTEGSANTHLYYLTSIPAVTRKNDLLSNLFGYGPGCSGYPQSVLMNFYPNLEKWSIECDYVNQLWSYGYIGFVVYYYWYIKNAVRTFKLDKRYVVLMLTFMFEGILYNITFNWVFFLLIAIFLLGKNKINIFATAMKGKEE